MTCIIGLEYSGKVYIGGDSASASGWDIRTTSLRKVFLNGQYLIGYTTSFRMGQLLQYATLPEYPDTWSRDRDTTLRFMVTEFIPAVRKIFADEGYTRIDNNREEAGTFLIGYRGFLFNISDDFQVNQYQDGIASIGCGASYGLGALEILLNWHPDEPERNLISALQASGKFSNGVCPPYYVESI